MISSMQHNIESYCADHVSNNGTLKSRRCGHLRVSFRGSVEKRDMHRLQWKPIRLRNVCAKIVFKELILLESLKSVF